MKKMTFLLLIASLILLSACSSNSEKAATTTDSGKKEITVWAWDPNFNIAALKLAKDRYVAKHPDVTVNIVEYAQNDIVQK